jgi:hypothetical protein
MRPGSTSLRVVRKETPALRSSMRWAGSSGPRGRPPPRPGSYQRLGMTEVARHGNGNIKITMRSTRPHQ